MNSLGGNNGYFAILYAAGSVITLFMAVISLIATRKYPDGGADPKASEDGFKKVKDGEKDEKEN